MTLSSEQLDLRIKGCALALSARRLWEHTEFGQVNPFAPVPAGGAIRPEAYIDVVNMSGPVQILTGLTLDDVMTGRHSGVVRVLVNQLLRHVGSVPVRQWLAGVAQHLLEFGHQRALRNMPQAFVATDSDSPFGIRGLHSALKQWLAERRMEKASVNQWQQRIDNLAMKGLRTDELAFSGLADHLPGEAENVISGEAVADCLHFEALRMSILPVLLPACAQLEFTRVPANADIKRMKPKLRRGLQSRPQWRDRVLGYWIDMVEWDDLLGETRGWMAFTHRGEPITADDRPLGLCTSLAQATLLANRHAQQVFPKMSARGEWSDIRMTGGADYREWLVTLPLYAPSYFSRHFQHRNVLLHVRCDVREGAQGERVLLLQEVQSDWAQQARREKKEDGTSPEPVPVPPWLQEWPSLAMKLVLLHAAQSGATALAWTTGSMQARRYGGLGKAGLVELYDRTFPAEAARLLRPFGKECASIEIFQPVNFYIEPADIGYEVLDREGMHVGTAATWDEALAILPDGAHEVLTTMHGVRLDADLKQAILARGFPAWGHGIRGSR